MRWGEGRKGERREVWKVKSGVAITRGTEFSGKILLTSHLGLSQVLKSLKFIQFLESSLKRRAKLLIQKIGTKVNICLEWEEVS